MNKKGYLVLENFIKKIGSEYIGAVIASEDKNIKKDYYDEIKILCDVNGIRFYNRLENKQYIMTKYSFAIGWRWIINNISNLIVLHDSILPKYRGFAPLVNSLINGENEIGVTALFANKEYDKGDIIKQKKIEVMYPIKIYDAIDKISILYSELVNEISLEIIQNKIIKSYIQSEKEATYSLWRDLEDYYIDWNKSAKYIKRSVDALGFPFNGARAKLDDREIIITDVCEVGDVKIENRTSGKVIRLEGIDPVIVCGSGLLIIQKAYYFDTKESLVPLKGFRKRFK